jgi:hypothetical protein
MTVPGTTVKRPVILERLLERRGVAFLQALADTCRAWPKLADWLCDEFSQSAKARENFRALVAAPAAVELAADGLQDISGEAGGWRIEVARLKAETGISARLYGGRTWTEMELLVRRYQAGNLDLGVFLLARHWRKLGDRARFAPELQRAGVELLDAVIRHGETRLWANLPRALSLLSHTNKTNLRGAFGHADWWKVHALLYMMRRPRPAYRTREVRAHLTKLGLAISSLDFRRFCKRHGIRRDMRAGRPRTRYSTPAKR